MWSMNSLLRNWREAMPEDRAVIIFFAAWIGIFITAVLWLGS